MRTTLNNVRLKNADEIRSRPEKLWSGSASIELEFEPVGEAKAIMEYIDWLPLNLRPKPLILKEPAMVID